MTDIAAAISGLRREIAELDALVAGRSDDELERSTPFHGWRPFDVLTHLAFIDGLARLALTDPPALEVEIAAMGEGTRPPAGDVSGEAGVFARLSAHEHRRLGQASPGQRLKAWLGGAETLLSALEGRDPSASVQWFGRPMKLGTLVAARQMEVWAYGQDVFDHFRTRRVESDRLRQVADFAVRTFRFSFANRGLMAPDAPFIQLTAPSGALWTWNAPDAVERVEGRAVDFCLVATQRRHVSDTDLCVAGAGARTWMEIAQCIAGAPVAGPRPGERAWG